MKFYQDSEGFYNAQGVVCISKTRPYTKKHAASLNEMQRIIMFN